MSLDDPLEEISSCSFFEFFAILGENELDFIHLWNGLKHSKFRAIDRLLAIFDFCETPDVVTSTVPEI